MTGSVDEESSNHIKQVQAAMLEAGIQQLDRADVLAARALLLDHLVMTSDLSRSEVLLPRVLMAADSGLPVHVITKDEPRAHSIRYEWKEPMDALGLTCEVLTEEWTPRARRLAYSRQVVFGSHRQFCADAITSHAITDPAAYWSMPMVVGVLADASETLLEGGQNFTSVATEERELAGAITVEGYLRRYPYLSGLLPPVSEQVEAMVSSVLHAGVIRQDDSKAAARKHTPHDAGFELRQVEREQSRPLDETTWVVFRLVDRAMSTRPFLPLVLRTAQWLDGTGVTSTSFLELSRRCDALGAQVVDVYARRVAVACATVAWSTTLSDLLNGRPSAAPANRKARRAALEFSAMARMAIREMIEDTAAQAMTFLLQQPDDHVQSEASAWANAEITD